MIVELFGLPGSGKTTLAKKLEARASFMRIVIKSRAELLLLNFLFFIKHPARFFILFFYIARNSSGARMFYFKFTNLFLQHNAKYEKALRYPHAIIDQGYFQNILSLFESPISVKKMLRYARFFRLPDLLLILDVSDPVREERMRRRGHSPRKEFGNEYVQEWKKTVLANYCTLLENINKTSVKWRVVDADNSIVEVYEEIDEVIKRYEKSVA